MGLGQGKERGAVQVEKQDQSPWQWLWNWQGYLSSPVLLLLDVPKALCNLQEEPWSFPPN